MFKEKKRSLKGVPVPHHKYTEDCETVVMPLPDKVYVPVLQHMGAPCTPLVKVGDVVKVGQRIADSDKFLTAPIHASVAGKVVAIESIINPMSVEASTIVIETDREHQEVDESVQPPVVNSKEDFIKAIRACGLVGLGGAGFPTHIKLNPKEPDKIDTLVINGAECEPYITSDFRNFMENGPEIIEGIEWVMKYLPIKRTIIGIESNKKRAIDYMRSLLTDRPKITVQVLKSQYPQGAEKVLIYETCRREVKDNMIPADVGVIVLNGTTVASIAKYMKTGMPMIRRRITVDGSAVREPKNVEVALGTRFIDIINFCGGYKAPVQEMLMGGPMMGTSVYNDQYPVVKNNNALLAFAQDESKGIPESACIRCSRCVDACPYSLMPVRIDRAYQARDLEELNKLKVMRCMECGCCAYACPAKRHRVLTNKLAKKFVRESARK